jgi:hypothetical protein
MPSWAGGWDNAPVSPAPYALMNEPGATARSVARLMAAQGNKYFGSLAAALTGAVPGGPVNAGYTQVAALQTDGLNQGGQRPVSTYVVVNRNTTVADEIMIDQQLLPRFMPVVLTAGVETSGYPVEKSGNSNLGRTGTVNNS